MIGFSPVSPMNLRFSPKSGALSVALLVAALTPSSLANDWGMLGGGLALGDNAAPRNYLTQETAAGAQMHFVALGWSNYEPTDGGFNTSYINQRVAEATNLRNKGLKIVLDLGAYNAPAWVNAIQPYTDQFGDVDSSSPNVLWSNTVRTKLAAYMQRVVSDFGAANIYAIRIGSGCHVEVRYPSNPSSMPHLPAGFYSGYVYWAFDPAAKSVLQQVSPWVYGLINWSNPSKPGAGQWGPGSAYNPKDSTGTTAGEVFFRDFYLGRLRNTTNWEVSVLRQAGYTGKIIILCPGLGVIGNGANEGYNKVIAANLTPADGIYSGSAGSGAVWDRIIAPEMTPANALGEPDTNVIIECSSFAEYQPNRNESSSDPKDWSSAHWIGYNADKAGFVKWAENPNPPDDQDCGNTMKRIRSMTAAYGYSGLCWAFEQYLFPYDSTYNKDRSSGLVNPKDGSTYATLSDYAFTASSTWYSGFEAAEGQPFLNDFTLKANVLAFGGGAGSPECKLSTDGANPAAHHGHRALSLAGRGAAPAGASAYCYALLYTPAPKITVRSGSTMTYWFCPDYRADSAYVGIDLHFTDGTDLFAYNLTEIGRGCYIWPSQGHGSINGNPLPTNQWSQVSCKLDVTQDNKSLVGKQIDAIYAVYDHFQGAGDYHAWIDDLAITAP